MHRRSFLTLPAAAAVAAPVSKREETRAVWIHPENLFKGSEAEGRKLVRDAVERFASANFNLILPWVPSDFLMALESEAYRDSHPTARWDALGVLIDGWPIRPVQPRPRSCSGC